MYNHCKPGCHVISGVSGLADCDDDFGYELPPDPNSMFLDGTYQVIKWQAFQASKWAVLLDQNGKEL